MGPLPYPWGMNNPILRQGFPTSTPMAVVQDQYGRTHQIPADQLPGYQPMAPAGAAAQGRMTFDDVLVKTSITIGLMVAVAAVAYVMVPSLAVAAALSGFGALVAFVVAMVVSFRKSVGAAGAIVYAVVEGVFVGAFSRIFEAYYPGIVTQAVLGTFVAAGLTLAAFSFFKVKVGNKLRRIVGITIGAYAVAMLLNFALSFAGINLGLYDSFGQVSLLGVGFTLLGTALAVFALVTDFDDIARGIAGGAPASQSWRAAFGLTVTMVWLYTNILRILSYFRSN